MLEQRRPAELSLPELAARRRNRRLLLLIAIPALVVGVAALVAAVLAGSSTPNVSPVRVPPGYKAVSDQYFGYAVPHTWTTNSLFTDDVGDLETSGPDGLVAEHLSARDRAPTAGEPPPSVFASFGVSPSDRTGTAQRITIPGATVAYLYRWAGKTGIDAWQASTGTELWMVIQASPDVTSTIISTLRA